MPKRLLKCSLCGEYALNYVGQSSLCKHCGGKLVTPHPPKFSMHDRFAAYTRRLKELQRKSNP